MNYKFVPFLIAFVWTSICFAFGDLNKAARYNLIGDKPLWDETPSDLKARLKIPFGETKTKTGGVLSKYVKGKFFGADANELKFEYENGKISAVKIVFFNKGDSVREGKWDSSTAAKIRADAKEILKNVVEEFGVPENSSIGSGATRIRAKEWKSAEIKILLGFEDKEFIIMHILPNAEKNSDTHPESVKSQRKDVASNVLKSDNGDISIKVPMVNQGGKGYCFPATIERLFMYYQVEGIDMHKLAEMFNTGVGGSTYLSEAIDAISKIARSSKLKVESSGIDFSKITKNIDEGVPMAWLMISTKEYNSIRRDRTKERASTDFEKWEKICRKEKKFKIKNASRDNGHICLIVGYNKTTKEVAVSDSWGDGDAAPTWISFDMAKAVSQSPALLILSPR